MAWPLESWVIVCQEDLVQSSCEMESHLCTEEEQAGIGCGFERLDWYRCQWGKSEGQQNQSLCLGCMPRLMSWAVALHTHSSQREDPGEVHLHVCGMHSFASIYAGYDPLPLCHMGGWTVCSCRLRKITTECVTKQALSAGRESVSRRCSVSDRQKD